MIDVFFSSLTSLFALQHLLYLLLGVGLGLLVGILPGLGGIAGLSLMLPFLYGMDTTDALAMLIGLVAVIPTSDTFTSVLMGIPGSSASQATVLDGFPLAKKGQGARALGAAFTASMLGGLFGAMVLTVFVLVARPVILLFGSAELFMLGVLGLSMVGVLAGSSLAKGLGACGLGLVLGTVGAAPATGEFRLAFDLIYLSDGVPLVVVGLGVFAIPEIVDLMRKNSAIADKAAALGSGWLRGVKDVFLYRWLVLRCAGIGAVVGFLPGLGGSVVDWIAYGHVVQTTKDRENFGKGDIRGVLAPESANNAKEGGALIPTLLFGIPGSGSMAVLLGGMILIGVQPGPGMVEENLDLTYVIIWSLALANVFGAGACLMIAKPVARLTTVPYGYLAPFMIMVVCFASFQATRDFGDLFALLGIGLLGVFMKRFGWPRPAFLIGFVLSGTVEKYFYQAIQFYEWNFLLRPGVLIIAAVTLASVYLGARHSPKGQAAGGSAPAAGDVSLAERWPQIAFAGFVAAVFAFSFVESFNHTFLGAVFPAMVAVAMLPVAFYVLYSLAAGRSGHPTHQDEESATPGATGIVAFAHYLYWFVGLVAATALGGFVIAITGFFLVFLRFKAGASWARTGILTAGAVGFMVFFSHALRRDFPAGLLQAYVDLPWPFR